MDTPIRGVELARREAKQTVPFGRRKLSTQEQAKRAERYMPLIANGQIPLDQNAAEMISKVMEREHRRMQRQRK